MQNIFKSYILENIALISSFNFCNQAEGLFKVLRQSQMLKIDNI